MTTVALRGLRLSRPRVEIVSLFGRAWADEVLALARRAAPAATVPLLNMGMSLTDVVMIGWLGTGPLAAAAVVSDAYSMVFYLAAGVVSAILPLLAKARGGRRPLEIRSIIRHSWLTMAVAGTLGAAAVWSLPGTLDGLGVAPELVEQGGDYARVMAGTLAFMMVVTLWRSVLMAFDRTHVFVAVASAALVLNAGANAVLMFGFAGWRGLGMAGAAAASLVVAAFMAIGLTAYVLSDRELRRFCPRPGLRGVRAGALVGLLRSGLAMGIAGLAEVGALLVATILAALLSTDQLAAHVIALRVAGLSYAAMHGYGQAVTVRVALACGGGDAGRIRMSVNVAIACAGTLGLAAAGLVLGSAGEAIAALSDGANAAAIVPVAAELLLVVAVLQPAQALGTGLSGIMRALGDAGVLMSNAVLGHWVLGLGTGWILAFELDGGAHGLWFGLAFGATVAAVLNGLWVASRLR